MFKIRKQKSNEENQFNHSALSPGLDKFIHALKLLTSVTQPDFELLYVTAVHRFLTIIQEKNNGGLEEKLAIVINALKRRRAYLLPIGADSESSFREQEEWTYAVFAAALLKNFDVSLRFEVAGKIFPKKGLAWLGRNKCLFHLWQCYLQEKRPNVFANIIENNCSFKNETIGDEEATTERVGFKKGDVIEGQNDATTATKFNSENKNKSLDYQADDFWQWLKQGIVLHTISINQEQSMVHGVSEGLFIVFPKAVNEFLALHVERMGAGGPENILKQKYNLMKSIKNHATLIRAEGGSRTHSYFLGEWGNHKVLTGIVVSARELVPEEMNIEVNPMMIVGVLS